MEIVKQNETFKISDTTSEGWTVEGSFSKTIEGNLDMNFNALQDTESIGNVNYNNYSGQASLNFNCSEENRDKFTAYIDTVIDTVLAYKGE